MSGNSPNSQLDAALKFEELKIKAIDAIGTFNLKLAQAEIADAQAMQEQARAVAMKMINDQLKIAIREGNKARRDAQDRRDRIAKGLEMCGPFQSGIRPGSVQALFAVVQGLGIVTAHLPSGEVSKFVQTKADAAVLKPEVWVSVRNRKEVMKDDVAAELAKSNTLGKLLVWMKSSGFFMLQFNDAHTFFLDAFGALGSSVDSAMSKIQQSIDSIDDKNFKRVEGLVSLLGLSSGVVKSPTVKAPNQLTG